jgi:hypothetical protein
VGLILVWSFTYFILKLIDQWKIKRLRKRFPEGTETKARAVKRLDDIPTRQTATSVQLPIEAPLTDDKQNLVEALKLEESDMQDFGNAYDEEGNVVEQQESEEDQED